MSKNALTTKTNEISLKGAQELVSEVTSGLELVQKGYLSITPQLAKLYDCKGFKALGYKNFDEMCTMLWGMSHGTTVGIRKVFSMVGTVSANNEYKIPEKYLEYGYTKLLKIAENKVDFEKANIKPFEVFTPDMTIKEMIDTLKTALEDKAKDQDDNAIDTTESTESTESTEPTEFTESNNDIIEITPELDAERLLNDIIGCADMIKQKYSDLFKIEKIAYLDAIVSNAKELKKEVKKGKK